MIRETDLSLDTSTGTLHGSLLIPDRAPTDAFVIFQPGSGPVDRDGNVSGMENNCLRATAHALAERGVASLRIDKRGVGESRAAGQNEEDLRIRTYADDLVSWARLLECRYDKPGIFLLGHSEGALIASIASQAFRPEGLILVAGVGIPASKLILQQIRNGGATDEAIDAVESILATLDAGELHPNPPSGLDFLFREAIQPYLISWFEYDPAVELSRLDIPALILQGGADLQISIDQADILSDAAQNATKTIFPRMNHVMKDVADDRDINIASYNDPDLPLTDGLVDAIVSFLGR